MEKVHERECEYDLDAEIAKQQADLEVDNEGYNKAMETFLAASGDRYKPAEPGLVFLGRPRNKIKALVEGFVYPGCISALVGPPKAGKSTFAWSMLAALLEGQPFLGSATKLPGNVLYISEQGTVSFDTQLGEMPGGIRERILRNPRFFLMLPEHHITTLSGDLEMPVTDWNGRKMLWKKAIEKTKAEIVVIDTFGQYADLGPQGENDNSMLSKRFFELRELQKARKSLAILLLSHTNKASQKSKTYLSLADCRGGNAFAGGLDHGVTFQKREAEDPEAKERYVHIESRVCKEDSFVVEWQEDGNFTKKSVPGEIGDILLREPELAKLGLRELIRALEKRGYCRSYRKVREAWLKMGGKERGSDPRVGHFEAHGPLPTFVSD